MGRRIEMEKELDWKVTKDSDGVGIYWAKGENIARHYEMDYNGYDWTLYVSTLTMDGVKEERFWIYTPTHGKSVVEELEADLWSN